MKGVCLTHRIVQREPVHLDFQRLQDAGVRVLCRLNWGYADGTGTVPTPADVTAWTEAVAETIDAARGAWGFVIGNELNNPAEWPGGYPDPIYHPGPSYYVLLYNAIAEMVDARLAPFSIDPYNVVAGQFGLPADPADWAREVYAGISRLDFVAMHAKTQGSDPAQCWSKATFADEPLAGRYLHLRTIEDQEDWIPDHIWPIDIYVTELNPQRRGDGNLGWERGNAEWVHEACSYLRTQRRVVGATFYRWSGDAWALEGNDAVLGAMIEEAS